MCIRDRYGRVHLLKQDKLLNSTLAHEKRLAVNKLARASKSVLGRTFKIRLCIPSGPGAVLWHFDNLTLMSSMVMGCSSGWSWSVFGKTKGSKRSAWVARKVSMEASKSGLSGWLWTGWSVSRKMAALSPSLTSRRPSDRIGGYRVWVDHGGAWNAFRIGGIGVKGFFDWSTETFKAKVAYGSFHFFWEPSVLRAEMLALPVSFREATNLAFSADQCKDLRGELLLRVANLFDGNGQSHRCPYSSRKCVVLYV